MSIQEVPSPSSLAPAAGTRLQTGSPWRLAMLLAITAAASGILLTGVSTWFLGAVVLAGMGPAALVFDFHTPSALVRLLALSKTFGKYGERVVGHRAALLDQVGRRARLFMAMAQAPSVRTLGWQLGNPDRLSDYMDDVEDLDYARLRVGMPAMMLGAGSLALTGATAWWTPLALLPIALLAMAVAIMLQYVLPRVTAHWDGIRSSQRKAGQLLASALASAVPLQAERAFDGILNLACASFREAEAGRLAQRRQLALLELVSGLVGPLVASSVLLAAWHSGNRGSALLIPVFIAFSWLAFGETVQNISRILLGRVRENAARDHLNEWAAAGTQGSPGSTSLVSLRQMTLKNIPRQTPDGRHLGEAINLKLERSRPTLLAGGSGTGKTTLLKQIAGWIGADNEGQFIGEGIVMLASYRRQISHLSLHDAGVLSDTVRANLFAPQATDADLWQALAAVELVGRVEAAGGLDAWITQDMLSLGEAQRINLARAFLSRSPIVLLDEPVEHLDPDQARRILSRLLSQLSNRVVVYSSHADDIGTESIRISLDGNLP